MLAFKSLGLLSAPLGKGDLKNSPNSIWNKLMKVEFFPPARSSLLSRFIVEHEACDISKEWSSELLIAKEQWPTALDEVLKDFVRN